MVNWHLHMVCASLQAIFGLNCTVCLYWNIDFAFKALQKLASSIYGGFEIDSVDDKKSIKRRKNTRTEETKETGSDQTVIQ